MKKLFREGGNIYTLGSMLEILVDDSVTQYLGFIAVRGKTKHDFNIGVDSPGFFLPVMSFCIVIFIIMPYKHNDNLLSAGRNKVAHKIKSTFFCI